METELNSSEVIKTWSPEDFGFIKREGQRVFNKYNFDLREIRPNIWLLRKLVNNPVSGKNEYLIKFFQYIPEYEYNLAKLLLEDYLFPKFDRTYNISNNE
jgi:hypothetical protein